jgi:multidrug efflux pump subunit AcrA (membrane-fusion protein)
VLQQQKSYQSVVAPFDGIITQRNVNVGSLVQAGSTFMFTLMQSDVIRTQVYVPQDAAFGADAAETITSKYRISNQPAFPAARTAQ